MYSLHDINVTGLPINEVLECEIESHIGEHSTLTLLAYTDNEDVLYELPDCQEVTICLGKGEEKRILFSGIVSDSELRETQTANYFSDIYPIDSAVLSANAQSSPKCCTLLSVLFSV